MSLPIFRTLWTWYPSVVFGCGGLAAGYLALVKLRPTRRGLAFLAGILVLLVALVSPLDALGDTYLFSAHMIQHLLLILVVPPLLIVGLPRAEPHPPAPSPLSKKTFDNGEGESQVMEASHRLRLPLSNIAWLWRYWRGGRGVRLFLPPLVAWFLGIGVMWLWHFPALYNAALADERIHLVEHLSFLVTSVMFWWPVLGPVEAQRMQPLAAIPYLFLASAATSLLGILLAFAPTGLYPAYLHPSDPFGILPLLREGWGITAAADQQAGGLLMWIAGGPVYLFGSLSALARWYAAPEEEREKTSGSNTVFGEDEYGK